MIAGERDPQCWPGLAHGRMKAKHDDLVAALNDMFDDHHGELAGLLLDQIAFLDQRIAQLTTRAAELAAAMPAAWGIDPAGPPARTPGPAPVPRCCPPWPGWRRSPASARTWPARSSPEPAWT